MNEFDLIIIGGVAGVLNQILAGEQHRYLRSQEHIKVFRKTVATIQSTLRRAQGKGLTPVFIL